jgi:hypothetical protein
MVTLDRVLCIVDWEDLYPNCLLQSLAKIIAHFILASKTIFFGTKRFQLRLFALRSKGSRKW